MTTRRVQHNSCWLNRRHEQMYTFVLVMLILLTESFYINVASEPIRCSSKYQIFDIVMADMLRKRWGWCCSSHQFSHTMNTAFTLTLPDMSLCAETAGDKRPSVTLSLTSSSSSSFCVFSASHSSTLTPALHSASRRASARAFSVCKR